MKIPSVIKIGGHLFKADFLSHVLLANTAKVDFDKQVITISDDAIEDKQAEAFLHEIVESINYMNNLEIGHKDITVLSEWLFMVLRDNKLRFEDGDKDD